MLNVFLKGKQYLVGDSLTLADVFLALIIVELQQCILDTNFRNSMSNLNNHFKSVVSLKEFVNRVGRVK